MPNDLVDSQGFTSGFTTGVVHTILGKKKQEEDEFYKLKDQRAKMIAGLADQVRQEDLPQLLAGLDSVISAKTPDKANAAFGDVLGRFITERFSGEQQTQERNTQNEQTAQEQEAQYQSDLAQGGTIVGRDSEGIPSRIPAQAPDAKPIKLDPSDYAKGKVRIRTEEGDTRRKIAVYSSQQQAQLNRQQAIERTKTDERIRAWDETHANEISGRSTITYDPDRNVTIQTARTKDGRTIMQEIPGVPTSYAAAQAKIKSTEELQKENRQLKLQMHTEKLKLEKEKLNAKVVMDTKRIAVQRERIATMGSGNESKLVKAQLDQLDKKWDNEKDILMKEMAQHLKNAERAQGTYEEDEDYEKAKSEAMKKYQETKHKYDLSSQEYIDLRENIIGQAPQAPVRSGNDKAIKSTSKASTKIMTVQEAASKYFK